MSEPNGSIRVTVREVYDEVISLRSRVDLILERMDSHARRHQTDDEVTYDQEQRLRRLERVAWMALGTASITPIVATIIVVFA